MPIKKKRNPKSTNDDILSLNTSRVLLDAVDADTLRQIAEDYISLLGTSAAIYEKNGDYACGIFASGWCNLLNDASRDLCGTKDAKKALACGKWLCHESCWKISKKAIDTKKLADLPCCGGIRICAVPVFANKEVVGAVNFGYGDPPKDDKTLSKLASLYNIDFEKLKKESNAYYSRSKNVINSALKHMQTYATLLGRFIENQLLAEETLRVKNKYSSLLDDIPEAIYSSLPDKSATVTFLSKRWHDWTGYSPDDFYNDPGAWSKSIVAEDRQKAVQAYVKGCNDGAAYMQEYRVVHRKTGKITYVRDHGVPIKDKDGKILRVDGVVTNITNEVKNKQLLDIQNYNLQESEKKYRALFETARDAIFIVNLKTHDFVYVNKAASKLTGYSISVLLKMNVTALFRKEDLPYVMSYFNKHAKDLDVIAPNIPVLRKDKSIALCDVNGNSIVIDGCTYVTGFFRDVTATRMQKKSLSTANRALMAIREVNHLLVQADSEQGLFDRICEILVAVSGYDLVWVGVVEHDKNKSIRPVAWGGLDNKWLLAMKECFTWDKRSCGTGSMGSCVRKGKTTFVTDMMVEESCQKCKKAALKNNYHVLISIPLKQDEKVVAVINIYSQSRLVPDDEELSLLEDMAGDISYGIKSLRLEQSQMAAKEAEVTALKNLRQALEDTVTTIALTVEKRDPYTAGHQRRVAQLAKAIAQKIKLPETQIEGLYFAALIHDIGKITIPSEILNKPGKLEPTEFQLVKKHSEAGNDIIKNISFPWPIAKIILSHHERLDGSGYPDGLRGKDINIESRILAIADVVEAMCSHRPYRPSIGIDSALKEIKKNKKKLYDEKVVQVCVHLFEKEKFKFLE